MPKLKDQDGPYLTEKTNIFQLSLEDQYWFVKDLINPEKVNDKLTRAAKQHAKLIVQR